jgi:hypothetical protein
MSLPTMTKTKWVDLHEQLEKDVLSAVLELKKFMDDFDSYSIPELEEALSDCQNGLSFWDDARKNVEDIETFDKIELLIGAILATRKTTSLQLNRLKNDGVFDPREN